MALAQADTPKINDKREIFRLGHVRLGQFGIQHHHRDGFPGPVCGQPGGQCCQPEPG